MLVAFTEYNRNVIRLEPPLICQREHVDRFVEALDSLLSRGIVSIVEGLREEPDGLTAMIAAAGGRRSRRQGVGQMMMKIERAPIEWALDTGVGKGIAQATTNRTLLDWLGAAFFTVVCVVIALYALAKPDYNWDMVAYVAHRAVRTAIRIRPNCMRPPGARSRKARGRHSFTRSSTATPTTSTSGRTRSTSSRNCRCIA